jgi:predicted nucleic acid-binding protein
MTVDSGPALITHCAVEAYSVLTRMPPPHRAPAELVAEFLSDRFPQEHLALGPTRRSSFISDLVRAGVSGGATYDGLVATVAAEHGATLVTLDRRAMTTYERLGAPFLLLA